MDVNNEIQPRQIEDGPWCWQNKETLRMIRDVFETTGDTTFAVAIYSALSELASDCQSPTFSVRISEIANRAGPSYRTTANILKRFESLKLIRVQRNTVPGTKEHAPSTYTMLGTRRPTLGTEKKASVPRRLKNRKTFKEPLSSLRSERTRSVTGAPLPSDGLNGLTEEECSIIGDYNATLVPLGWFEVNKATDELQKVLELHDAEEWHELFRDIANAPRDEWPKRLTLVRFGWDNY